MDLSEHALEGDYEHKLDAKCRVSVPSEWRDGLGGGQLRYLQSTSYEFPALRVLTELEYRSMIAKVESREWTPAEKQMVLGKLHSRIHKAALSEQGKILVPKALCEWPRIEASKPLKLVGRGTYFEILNVANFDEMKRREDEKTKELDAELGFF